MKRKIKFKKSSIHGKGVFANTDMKKHTEIGTVIQIKPRKKGEERLERKGLGKYINHKNQSNTYLKKEGNKIKLFAKKNIKKGDELFSNYKEAEKTLDIAIKRDF
jgi:SET domain-containing protein